MSKAQFIAENLKPGEEYAGILLGKNGAPDQHIILLPGSTVANWSKSGEWAKEVGGELPTRREQSLLFANLPELFEKRWHWSCEQGAAHDSSAWMQYFGDGDQSGYHKYDEYAARAVRRLALQ